MTTKATFAEKEWNLLADAPFWVQVALTSHRAGGGTLEGKKYVRTLEEALSGIKARNQLVKDIVAASEGRRFEQSPTFNTAKQTLEQIGLLLDQKVESPEADEVRSFLLAVGQKVAEETSEGLFGMGADVSSKEKVLLEMIAVALKATEADEQRRTTAAKAKADAEAKAKQAEEAARKQREAETKAEKAAEEAARKQQEAEAKAKKAAEEAAARKQQEAEAKRSAQAESARKQQEAKAKAEAAQAMRDRLKRGEGAEKAPEPSPPPVVEKTPDKARSVEAKPTTPSPAPKKASESGRQTYVVKAGDSLSKIAQGIYGDLNRWRDIYEANKDKIANPDAIEVGQELIIPEGTATPRFYEVKSGDSLSKIAQEVYGQASRWQEIFEANKDQIKDPGMIHPGQKLRIP